MIKTCNNSNKHISWPLKSLKQELQIRVAPLEKSYFFTKD